MEAIINNLKDPSWWFSAFFITIIASVIAGLMKDRIEKWLSSAFSGLKSWRAKREEVRTKVIEALLADHMYFQIALFRAVIMLTLFSLCSVLYYAAPIFLSTMPVSSDQIWHMDSKFIIWDVLTPVLGFFNTIMAYRVVRYLSVVFQAVREYRKRNDLPKLL